MKQHRTHSPGLRHAHSFRAMGSTIGLWLETDSERTAAAAFEAVESLFAEHEAALSRFRPESELSRLNAQSGAWVRVSDLLWDVLGIALEMSRATGGYFDPTLLGALEQAGYTRTFEDLGGASENPLAPARLPYRGRWRAVQRAVADRSVCLPRGVALDLGGIAKGHTARTAAELLGAYGACLVDAGGDVVAGAAPAGLPGWPVAISAPADAGSGATADLCTVWLADATLATSGIDYRRWQHNGRAAHHVIDPFTGQPAETDLLTVTVLAAETHSAEAWATATLVAGSGLGMQRLADRDMDALAVTRSGGILTTPGMHRRIFQTETTPARG